MTVFLCKQPWPGNRENQVQFQLYLLLWGRGRGGFVLFNLASLGLVCFSPMVSFASESLSYHTQSISVSICPGSSCFSLALYFSIAFSSSLLPLLVSVHSFPPSYNSAGPIQASLVRAHAPSASLGISKPS